MKNQKYIRQTRLAEVGEAGQEKLLKAHVLIVGCGGLGGEVAVHLAASGVGNLTLADFDVVSESNLHRQVFFNEQSIGKRKTETLKTHINKLNSDVNVKTFTEAINKTNIRKLIQTFDIVVDCTDVLETKYLLNDACVLENKILVYGSLHKYEGQVAVFNTKDEKGKRTANLRDVFPEIPQENIPSCSEVGTLNAVVSIIASLQTNEVLKLILGIGKPLVNTLLIYNSLSNEQFKMQLKVNNALDFVSIWNINSYEEINCAFDSNLEITKEDFLKALDQNTVKVINVLAVVIDVDFKIDFHLPLAQIEAKSLHLETAEYVLVCQKGKTSLKAVKLLKEMFPESGFRSLLGGFF